MKTTAFKTKKNTILTIRSRARQSRKPAKKSRVFRFAPDAAGIMRGPADLSMREGLSGKVRKSGSRMDLADACVLRLAERNPDAVVITLDTRDFGLYRLHRDDPVPLLHPP